MDIHLHIKNPEISKHIEGSSYIRGGEKAVSVRSPFKELPKKVVNQKALEAGSGITPVRVGSKTKLNLVSLIPSTDHLP